MSFEKESLIIASMLESEKSRKTALRLLRPENFSDKLFNQVFEIVSNLESDGLPIDQSTIFEELNKQQWQPERDSRLISLLSGDLATSPNIEPHCKDIIESSRDRIIIQRLECIRSAYENDKDKTDILNDFDEIRELLISTSKDIESKVFIPSWNNRPDTQKPLVTVNGVRVLTPENVAMLTAFAGSGKTSVFGAACASIFPGCKDSLGIEVNAESVLYIDTECAYADSHMHWEAVMRRGDILFGTDTSQLKWECIRGLASLDERKTYLWDRIDNSGVPQLVIIDGIGDFVADPNDSEECTGLIYKLSSIACERGIGIWTSLHTNPGPNQTKARGVLGSELWRKAESSLIIEKIKDSQVRRLTTSFDLGKNRGGTDDLSSFFKWDDNEKMHVSCSEPIQSEKKGATAKDYEKIVSAMESNTFSYSELIELIEDVTGKKKATAKRRVAEMQKEELIIKINGIYKAADSGDF